MKVYLTLNVSFYVLVGDVYLYEKLIKISDNYISIYVPIGPMSDDISQ